MAFNNYYLKIGDCTFQNPAIKREGFKVNPRIVQVTEAKTLASGKISFKKLQHQPTKIVVDFPYMKPEQWRNYCKYFRGEKTGEEDMYVTMQYYDEERDGYFSGIFYHGDLEYTEAGYYNGMRMIKPPTLSLIEH